MPQGFPRTVIQFIDFVFHLFAGDILKLVLFGKNYRRSLLMFLLTSRS